jgi:tetratricopeptide (TPR) repeat protein
MSPLALALLLLGSAKAGEEYEAVVTLDLSDHGQFSGRTEARIGAHGKEDGRLYVAFPEAIAMLDGTGRFVRRAFTVRPPDMAGMFAVDGKELIYVSRRDQVLKRLLENGEVVAITPRSEKLARGVAVFRGEGGELFALVEPEGLCMRCVHEVLRFTKTGTPDGVIGTVEYDLNAAGPRGAKVGVERAEEGRKRKANFSKEEAAVKKVVPLVAAGKITEEEVLALAASEDQKDNWYRSLHNYGVSEAAAKKMADVHEFEKKRLDDDVRYWEGVARSFADDVPRRPCGLGAKGVPITVTVNRVHTYSLSKLDRGLLPAGPPLWGIAEDEHIQEVERFESEAMQRPLCDQLGDLVLLGWEHSGQMSLYRGTKPIFHSFEGMGENLYAILSDATLATVLRGQIGLGKIRLFARKDRDGKDPIFVHRRLSKDPKNLVSMLDNMIDAGWWENAVKAADDALAKDLPKEEQDRVRARLARARAAELLHYAEVEASAEIVAKKRDEATRLAADHPGSAVAQYAAALTLRAAGDSTAYAEHLERTRVALTKDAGARWSDYPRLFDLFAARGDVASMMKFAAETKKTTTELDRRMFEARIARVEGAYDAALESLKPLGDRYGSAVALRALVQMDAGRLDDAILSFTKANGLGLATHSETQHGLGLAYLRRGLLELSIEALSKAVAADPANATYASNLAAAYAGLDKREDAMKHLFTALAKSPADPVLRFQLERMSAPKTAKAGGALIVMPLSTYGGATQRVGLGEMIASMLITAISEAKGPEIVERARLDEVLAEQKLQATAHFDAATTVRVGKLIGAKRVVLGNVAEFDGRLLIDVRVVDVESGKVLDTKRADTKPEADGLRSALSELAAAVK